MKTVSFNAINGIQEIYEDIYIMYLDPDHINIFCTFVCAYIIVQMLTGKKSGGQKKTKKKPAIHMNFL